MCASNRCSVRCQSTKGCLGHPLSSFLLTALCAVSVWSVGCGTLPRPDTETSDGASDSGSADTPRDDGGEYTGSLDAGASDAGISDAGISDAGISDAGISDAGTSDASTSDAGTSDAGTLDAGTSDAGTSDAGATDGGGTISASEWSPGLVDPSSLPRASLLPLPGGGIGPPVVTSNNPELFTGLGLLYGTARSSPSRGGAERPLTGRIGVYLHHVNQQIDAGTDSGIVFVSVLLENPATAPNAVTVSGFGSGYTQTETGGLQLKMSPDYRVSEDWITNAPNTRLAATILAPGEGVILFQRTLARSREIDGRFEVIASGPVTIQVVASATGVLSDVRTTAAQDAPGDIRVSNPDAGLFGRTAGTYAHDTWQGTIDIAVPEAPRSIGFVVNTATGSGFRQVQAFPALTHFTESARESVGMYGNVYDLTLRLRHDGAGASARRVRVSFASLSTGTPSRWWDGAGIFNGMLEWILNKRATRAGEPWLPTEEIRVDVLGEVLVEPGITRNVDFRAMVPGLTSIPQALFLETVVP